jgi:3-deoxy-D-manno-octulosonic-acid transferase
MGLPREQMGTGMLFNLYSAATTAASPVIAAGMAFSARGRRRFGERLGSWKTLPPLDWWLHGASVGEVQGLLPCVDEIRARAETEKILLTSTSPTGLDRGESRVDATRLLPLDAAWCVRRALRSVNAKRFVLSETELWPVFLREVVGRGIPCYVVNGRVSDYTIRWYQSLRSLFQPIMREFHSVCVPNNEQRERYQMLGVQPSRIHVTGHTKYDVEPKIVSAGDARVARETLVPHWGADEPIIVLGSIRPGEEDAWFGALASVWTMGKRARVIVAPRHMEKLDYFEDKLKKVGARYVRWSQVNSRPDADVIILDVMGKLESAYSIASLAFVGATLVDIGGHNPLEPAMYGVPVVVGPYTSVIRDVVGEMREARGILEVAEGEDLSSLVERSISREGSLVDLGKKGQTVWLRHRGAAKRVVSIIAGE